jgi:hypothetical protein
MKPGTLVRIKETPILTYQGYSNKIGIIVKTTKEHTSFDAIPVIMHVVLIEEKLALFNNNELDKVET